MIGQLDDWTICDLHILIVPRCDINKYNI
jgi:hypothetical protein